MSMHRAMVMLPQHAVPWPFLQLANSEFVSEKLYTHQDIRISLIAFLFAYFKLVSTLTISAK